MKRHLLKLVLFLLAGAIINLAVAWACALWIVPQPLPNWLVAGEPLRWAYELSSATGTIRLKSYPMIEPTTEMFDIEMFVIEPGRGPEPAWSRISGPADDSTMVEDGRGWPAISLCSELMFEGSDTEAGWVRDGPDFFLPETWSTQWGV